MRKKLLLVLLTAAIFCVSGCSAVTGWIDEQRAKIFPEESASLAEEQTSEKPNTINTGVYDFDTFNPLITQSQSVREAMQLVYEPLYTLDNEMRPVPVLAQGCEKSEDGRTIMLNIRQDVAWHDGTPLTSTDVAYTFRMIREGRTTYTENLSHIADYIIADDYSIRITLDKSAPVFEAMLTFPVVKYQTDMTVNSRYVPNGTGPFCYGMKSSVNEIYFGAFDGYRDGRAGIDAMYIHTANTQEKYMTMLEASEIDFSSGRIVDLMEYMPKGSLTLHDYPENRMVFLGFNMANDVLSGALTRKGLSELIDKDYIVDSVIFSHGTPSDIPINPASYLYCGTASSFDADELAANDDLGNDGWGPDADGKFVRTVNGSEQRLSLEILANSDSKEQIEVAEAVAAHMNRFGVEVSVIQLPYDAFTSRVASGMFDMFIGETELPANMELTSLTSPAGNYFAYNNPGLDTINAQMGMAASEDELKALFEQYAQTVLTDMPFAVIYYKTGSLISSANVKSGIDPSYVWLYKNCAAWSVR